LAIKGVETHHTPVPSVNVTEGGGEEAKNDDERTDIYK
jgi:hypothetical protein